MQYVKVITSVREALITTEATGWGRPYQELYDQTDVSGYEKWLAYATNSFKNAFQRADKARFEDRGWWAEIVRDKVREGAGGIDSKGRLSVVYVSHAGTEWEQVHGDNGDLWAPKNGWYVPTDDDVMFPEQDIWIPFHEGTLIPRETVTDRHEAIRRLEAKGIPPDQVSSFYRLDRYPEEQFVGVGFYPWTHALGRFTADMSRVPTYSGGTGVGSRPAHNPPANIIMEVDLRP